MITIHLTEDGEQLIQQVLPEQVAAITAEMSALTPEEQQNLGDLCRKLGSQDSAAF
jgi:MarR family 2-MHQ and catechol resistance regulon transcriptional repressor